MEWEGDQFLDDVERVYAERVGRAAEVVAQAMRGLISGPGHTPTHKAAAGAPPGTITGALLKSITVVHEGLDARVGATDWTAQFIELGTARMPAHPFIRRALADSNAEITDIITNG